MSAQPVSLDMSTAQPIQAVPVKLDMSTAQPIGQAAPDSAPKRLGTNFLSGLGVTSNEQAKNFFVHPLDTVIKSFEAQGELAKKARDAYSRGDYMGALQHGLNYLVPFVGQQTDQAGEQLKGGDIAGGVGRTLGAAVPLVAGSPEVRTAVGDAASAATSAVKPALSKVGGAATAVGQSLDPDLVGLVSPRAAHALRLSTKVGKVATKLGTETPMPARPELESTEEVASPAAPEAAPPAPMATTPSGESIPRTLSGDSALRQILTGQDNANLLKIAKSRGINVTKEAQLKPGTADNLLVNKIINDFSPDELDEVGARYLENSRMGRHNFGDIGAEAQKTLSLQTYFPEMKIPAATLKRTQAAIGAGAKSSPAPTDDLLSVLQESLKRVQQQRAGQ